MITLHELLTQYGPVVFGAVLRLAVAYLNSRSRKLDPTIDDQAEGK